MRSKGNDEAAKKGVVDCFQLSGGEHGNLASRKKSDQAKPVSNAQKLNTYGKMANATKRQQIYQLFDDWHKNKANSDGAEHQKRYVVWSEDDEVLVAALALGVPVAVDLAEPEDDANSKWMMTRRLPA